MLHNIHQADRVNSHISQSCVEHVEQSLVDVYRSMWSLVYIDKQMSGNCKLSILQNGD